MPSYGRTVLEKTGIPINIVADGRPVWGMIGKTIDWTTVTPLASAYTDQSGISLPAGVKMLRFGQPMCTITASGLIGPFDPAASDGRQNPPTYQTGGLLNETIIQNGLLGITTFNDTNVGLIVGGYVYIDRVIQSGTAAHSLAAGPTLAELMAGLPDLRDFKL
jgi:hypothetical protein